MATPQWLTNILGGNFLSAVEGIIGKFKMDPSEKAALQVELARLADQEKQRVSAEITAELQAKERIIVAELNQEDKVTKRARPFVIYSGPIIFFAMAIMHYIAWYTGQQAPPAPPHFEWFIGAWASYGSVYAFRRSSEKIAKTNGNGKHSVLLG